MLCGYSIKLVTRQFLSMRDVTTTEQVKMCCGQNSLIEQQSNCNQLEGLTPPVNAANSTPSRLHKKSLPLQLYELRVYVPFASV